MGHYFEMAIRPDPDFVVETIINSVYNRFHLILADQKELNIGISFPDYDLSAKRLGSRLRFHGEVNHLTVLKPLLQQGGVQDYVSSTEIQVLPQTSEYVAVHRVQVKSNPLRLARRYARRHQITEEEALLKYQSAKSEYVSLPYVVMNSRSSGQRFRLFIRQERVNENNGKGRFNTYGLSKEATLAYF